MSQPPPDAAAPIGRLLFVDDDRGVRQSFSGMLRRVGYDVDVAANGVAALEMARHQAYDALITDLLMPGIDGLILIQRLHAIDDTCSSVLITGAEDLQLPSDQLGDSSIVSVVAKPCSPEELEQTVRRAVEMTGGRRRCALSGHNETHVLLIEDNRADAHLVQLFLRETSAVQVTTVSRLEEALDAVHLDDFQIILADLTLPDARGLDAVTRLQAASPKVPIIVLTGLQDDEIARHALALGAQDYLLKSELEPKGLQRTVRHAVERKQAEMRLSFMAHYDPLTELGNRNQFNSRVAHAVARFGRESQRFSVLYLDLDGFKEVNDLHGHAAGDAVLKEVANRIRHAVREPDSVARLGGDEFAVLLENVQERGAAATVAHRIARAVDEPIPHGSSALRVRSSIGIAFFPEDGTGIDGLLRSADAAMYQAKREGGGSFRFAHADMTRPAAHDGPSADEIERAFARGEIELFFQPQFSVLDRRLTALEALIRWNRGPGDMVLPRELLPRIESVGWMDRLGAWAIEEATDRLMLWRRKSHRDLRIAVNVSPAQLASDLVYDAARRALDEGRLSPGALEVELTEDSLLSNCRQSRARLDDLRGHGVRIAVDDFGKGTSSLAYLQELTVDKLKIDRSFIAPVNDSSSESPIASCIIGLGRHLGLDVVAEGVETPAQLRFLEAQNCPAAQGFFLQVPVDADGVEELLAS